mmetsp:Transcript_46451/g.112606  ORF Transcript_46451/g.112606 Transcript_46451/m.112606 type:complete len:111 (+) Transcript_46451:1411-1743(+)
MGINGFDWIGLDWIMRQYRMDGTTTKNGARQADIAATALLLLPFIHSYINYWSETDPVRIRMLVPNTNTNAHTNTAHKYRDRQRKKQLDSKLQLRSMDVLQKETHKKKLN